jgi:plastocyanin
MNYLFKSGKHVWKGKIFIKIFIIVFISIVSEITGCSKSSNNTTTPAQGANEVWIQNTAFNPTTLTVAVNTTIKWTNKDGVTHTVTSDSSLFNSGNIASNGTYSHQFTTKGTYTYHCTIHSMMTAKVIVQ